MCLGIKEQCKEQSRGKMKEPDPSVWAGASDQRELHLLPGLRVVWGAGDPRVSLQGTSCPLVMPVTGGIAEVP